MASRTVFDRIWDLIRSSAWWSFTLMASTSAFLVGGVVRELARKRPGPFALVTFVASLLIGMAEFYG